MINIKDEGRNLMHNGHRGRLKERFLKEGLDNFEQHNVLELALFYVIPRRDTNEIAHRLIERFGSISRVMDASVEDLVEVNGIGESVAVFLKFIPEFARRYIEDKGAFDNIINSTEKAGQFLLPKFIGRTDENIIAVSLDSKCSVINSSIVSEGSVNEVSLNIRKLVEIAIKNKAISVILAHNHPNGLAIPSNEDIETTWKVKRALDYVGVNLLDHIIVANNDFVSMRDSKKFQMIFEPDLYEE